MAASIAEEFRRQAEAVLVRHPGLRHEWAVEEGGALRLDFPADGPDGFPVQVLAGEGYANVFALGAHELFEAGGDEPPGEVAAAALGLVRDLLSPDMRLRELSAGGRPYKWILEARDAGGGWRAEHETGLVFFNYFGARAERVYQNRQLPGRLVAAG